MGGSVNRGYAVQQGRVQRAPGEHPHSQTVCSNKQACVTAVIVLRLTSAQQNGKRFILNRAKTPSVYIMSVYLPVSMDN